MTFETTSRLESGLSFFPNDFLYPKGSTIWSSLKVIQKKLHSDRPRLILKLMFKEFGVKEVEMIECTKYGKLRAGFYENESGIFFGTDPIQEFQDFFLILQFCQVFGILAIVLMPKGLM